jgi:hypothetical protein
LPTVYEGGKAVTDFDLEFMLVNIASGASNSNKFAILKNNEFPTLSRGKVKKITLREYIKANIKKNIFNSLSMMIYIVLIIMIHHSSSNFLPFIRFLIFDSHSCACSKPLIPCW